MQKKNAHYNQKLTLGDIIVFRSMFGDLSSPFPEIDAFVFDWLSDCSLLSATKTHFSPSFQYLFKID